MLMSVLNTWLPACLATWSPFDRHSHFLPPVPQVFVHWPTFHTVGWNLHYINYSPLNWGCFDCNSASSDAVQKPHKMVRLMKPLRIFFGSHVGTHEMHPLPVCPLHVHLIKWADPSSSLVVEPVLVLCIALELFNKFITTIRILLLSTTTAIDPLQATNGGQFPGFLNTQHWRNSTSFHERN